MGISDKLSQFAGQVQDGVKNTSISLVGVVLKIITAFIIGLTFSLIGQEIMKYETVAFTFVMTVVIGIILKIISKWSVGQVLLFDLFCILIGLLLRMYILVAP